MSKRKTVQKRWDAEAVKLMNELRLERIKKGIDKKPVSDARWSLALARGIEQDIVFKNKLLTWKIDDEIV